MHFRSLSKPLIASGADCLIVFVASNGDLLGQGEEVDKALKGKLAEIAKSDLLGRETGASLVAPFGKIAPFEKSDSGSVLLYRLATKKIPADKYHPTIRKLASTGLTLKTKSVAVDFSALTIETRTTENIIGDFCTTLHHSTYRFEEYKSKKKPALKLKEVHIADTDIEDAKGLIKQALALAEGVRIARDLGNMPGNDCTPSYLAEFSETFTKKKSISVDILDEDEMESLGMGSLLSVSAGSVEPAKLIVIHHNGGKASEAPHILVGKGITFDTGGISLKPGGGMDEMKYDMCGAASVIGTMHAIADMKLPLNVIGIVAAAENMPSGIATKPGDIVTSMSGKTIEVLNTDAEGRLVLCDALTYAEKFNPATIIDIATLTGAVIVALGRHATGLYANDDDLANKLLEAGQAVDDRVWQMPLWKEYTRQLESPFADLANIGGRDAGSVTAACFLSQFTEKQKWAHLDIAGTAWKSGKAKGATGRPVKLLVEYLRSQTS